MNVSEETVVSVFRVGSSVLICPQDGSSRFLKNAGNNQQGL